MRRAQGPALALVAALVLLHPASAAALAFTTSPDVPNLPGLTLNGKTQTLTTTMNAFGVSLGFTDASGFNITAVGDSSVGKSAVFKVYCPGPSACGTDPAGAYVSGGATLPARSLTLNSTGASWTRVSGGTTGATPSLLCGSGCSLDSATAVKIASQTAGLAVSVTWATTGWSSTSISAATPTTLRKPLNSGEVYRVDLVWTLGSGP